MQGTLLVTLVPIDKDLEQHQDSFRRVNFIITARIKAKVNLHEICRLLLQDLPEELLVCFGLFVLLWVVVAHCT